MVGQIAGILGLVAVNVNGEVFLASLDALRSENGRLQR